MAPKDLARVETRKVIHTDVSKAKVSFIWESTNYFISIMKKVTSGL